MSIILNEKKPRYQQGLRYIVYGPIQGGPKKQAAIIKSY